MTELSRSALAAIAEEAAGDVLRRHELTQESDESALEALGWAIDGEELTYTTAMLELTSSVVTVLKARDPDAATAPGSSADS